MIESNVAFFYSESISQISRINPREIFRVTVLYFEVQEKKTDFVRHNSVKYMPSVNAVLRYYFFSLR